MESQPTTEIPQSHFVMQEKFAALREMSVAQLAYHISNHFGSDAPEENGQQWLLRKAGYLTVQQSRPFRPKEATRFAELDKPSVIALYKKEALTSKPEMAKELPVSSKAFTILKDAVLLTSTAKQITKKEFTELLSNKSAANVATELNLSSAQVYQIKKALRIDVRRKDKKQSFAITNGEVYIRGVKATFTKADFEKLYHEKAIKAVVEELNLPSQIYVYKLLDHFGIKKGKKTLAKKGAAKFSKEVQDKCIASVEEGNTYLSTSEKYGVPLYKVRQWCIKSGVTSVKSKK